MEIISSRSNNKIKYIKELSKKAKKRKDERAFVAEGERLCSEIEEKDLKLLVFSKSYNGPLREKFKDFKDTIFIEDKLMDYISSTKTSQGVLAVVGFQDMEKAKGDFFIILENLQDPGNLGTIFRTAEAAGVDAVIMNSECADIYSPKVVRSTMGAIFRMPFVISDDILKTVTELKKNGIKLYAAHLKGNRYHYEEDYKKACAFLIGNEGNGLTDELSQCSDTYIKIPMKGKTESLNAASAACVLMYETLRQRMGGVSLSENT